MKRFAAVMLLGLLAGVCTADDPVPYKACEGAAEISCSAYTTLSILTTGGKCWGTAKADCEAVGVSQDKYVEAYEEWWGGGDDLDSLCDGNKITAAANAVATAIAEVWTSAKAQVSCDGQGEACGYSISNGNAYATAIAEALAQAAAEVVVGSAAEAFCYADVRAVSGAIAQATAAADAAACVSGPGTNEAWNESYISAVATAIADAFATASASACADKAGTEASAESECTGDGSSTVESDVYGIGNVCGGVENIPACVGKGKDTCCDPKFNRTFCRCEDCDGPWLRKSNAGDAKKIFENKSSKRCFCLDTSDEGVDTESTEPEETVEPEETTVPEETVEPEETTVPEETEEPTETIVPEETEEPTETAKPTTCQGAPDTSCTAYAILDILVTEGTCTGKAEASCEAVATSQNAFKEAYEEWWSEDGAECDSGKAEAAAKAIGTATATVWADAAVKVKCEGVGFACGWSASGGTAVAVAFAEAIAQAAAEAVDPYGAADAFCFSDVRAVSGAIASAAADAQADACSTGKEVEDYKESLAVSIAEAVASAFASATAEACSSTGEARASSTCEGDAESTTTEETYELGDACAATSQIPACAGPGKEMCCASSLKTKFCLCGSKGCDHSPWTVHSPADSSTNAKRVLKYKNGEFCMCI